MILEKKELKAKDWFQYSIIDVTNKHLANMKAQTCEETRAETFHNG
jgi:hypothetical protein